MQSVLGAGWGGQEARSTGSPSPGLLLSPPGNEERRGAEGRGARGPSLVISFQKAETCSGGLGAPLPLAPHLPSLHCRVPRVQLVAPVQSPALRTAESAFVCSHVSSGSVAWNTSQSPRVWGRRQCNIELGLFFATLALQARAIWRIPAPRRQAVLCICALLARVVIPHFL